MLLACGTPKAELPAATASAAPTAATVELTLPQATLTALPTASAVPSPTPVPLEGVWHFEGDGLSFTLTLRADGSYTLTQNGVTAAGSWTEAEGQLLFAQAGSSYACAYRLEGGALVLLQEGFDELTLTREAA